MKPTSTSPAAKPPVTDGCAATALYSIGHSTHPIERFVALLAAHQIAQLADVRSFPGSRRWPWFNREALPSELGRAGVTYRWFKNLGGRRRANPESIHRGWKHAAFRAYADYMETAEFEQGLAELINWGKAARTAFMCSEGLWWRCHRRMVSDALVVRGLRVVHILPTGKLADHILTPFAVADGTRLSYPAPASP